ncbi:hypothetical protein AVEN_128992-1 [Araneus ventricosus]|uniref:Uncharacterized protein n=1 Tax=Araneus ventricosus TaxID=182803 RepID=A0A4Y2GCF6_ARAVE|nr:hypothetical protein AVEN_128992-1 [Araneus ventricosus]
MEGSVEMETTWINIQKETLVCKKDIRKKKDRINFANSFDESKYLGRKRAKLEKVCSNFDSVDDEFLEELRKTENLEDKYCETKSELQLGIKKYPRSPYC